MIETSDVVCAQCGKKLGPRETYFAGAYQDSGELYALHPACRAEFIKKTGDANSHAKF
jgi:hypothetical protein